MRELALALALASAAAAGGLLDGSPAPAAVRAAHAAYLAGDYDRAAALVREGLAASPDEAVASNLIALADGLMERAGDRLALGWSPPAEIRQIVAGTTRERVVGRGPERRRLRVVLGLKSANAVRALTVVRHPGRVMIDTARGIGISGDHHSPRWGSFLWALHRLDEREPADGLYTLETTLASGAKTAGWFVLARASASATPVVEVPAPEMVIAEPNPTFAFARFASPERRPFDARELDLAVERVEAGRDPEDTTGAWGLVPDDPGITSVAVKPGPGVDPPDFTKLVPGRYRFELTCREQRRFGPVTVTRDASTAVPFTVRY